jgi:integrase/recombinase XerD
MAQAKTLNEQELAQVLAYINARKHSVRNRAMFLTTHLAGMRVGEVAALRYCDVFDAEGRVRSEIRLAADQTKGAHARVVFINQRLRKELTSYAKHHPCNDAEHKLFYTQKRRREGFSANTMTQYFLSLYRAVGLNGASSHSGRRTFATTMASKGVSVRVLMRALGHRNISTTMQYVDANDDMIRRAVELV